MIPTEEHARAEAAANLHQTSPSSGGSHNGQADPELERRVTTLMGENTAWWATHEADLRRQHPEWEAQFVVVASRTVSKVLAVAQDRVQAIAEALRSPELVELAGREGLPAGCLATAALLGGGWDE